MSGAWLVDRLEEVASRWAHHGLHFVDRRQELRYPSFAHRVRQCARALVAAGLRRGDNVALLLPTCGEFFVALLGAQRAGLVPSPFAPPASASRLTDDMRAYARVLRAGQCRAVIIDEAMGARLGAALDGLGVPVLVLERLLAEAAVHGEAQGPPGEVEAVDLALVQYTSGSTSHPKGVALTHAQLAAGIDAIVQGIALTGDDVNGQWLPVHHDMGLIGSLAGVATGVQQFLWSPLTFVRDPARWLTQFAARRATIYAGPNFSYAELCARSDEAQLATLDLSAWRVAFNGAEPVHPQVLRRFVETFSRCGFRAEAVMPVYGLAETTLAATFPALGARWRSRQVDGAALGPGAVVIEAGDGREVVSVGAAVAGHELRIRHQGVTLSEGRVGEIQVRGPAVMAGYFRDPQATDEAFEDGWLRTGDLGFLARGDLYVTGRVKEMMILHGKNYYPHDVEEVVQAIPGCHRGMAVAFTGDDSQGEHMIVVAETRLSDAEACAQWAAASQRAVRAALSIPRLEVVLVRPGSVPRTTSGKRQRLLVKARLQQRELRDSVIWSSDGASLEVGARS